MVQLSSPPVDMIPVKKGPSPEIKNAPYAEDNGFKTAYNEQKEIHDSRIAEKKTASEDKVSYREQKTEEGSNTKNQQKADESSSAADKSTTPVSGSSEKSAELTDKSTTLKLVKSDSGKKILKLSASDAEEKADASKIKTAEVPAVLPGQDVQSLIAASEMKGGSPAAAGELKEADSVSILLNSTEELVTEENKVQSVSDELSTLTVKTAPSSLLSEASEKENGKGSKSDIQQKKESNASELKITVEDKRTIKETAPVLKMVESDSASNKMTLELIPSDDVASAMPQGEQADTGKTFSLMSAEEQKGAALLDRQLQDKGTQELTKNIRFVLKDNKEGEIKLILKPEALGKVRINLNLNENNIVGKIIVENNSVRQAFLNNLADLTKALEDSGFSSASLDVSVGGGQTESGSQYRDEAPVYFTSDALDDMDGQIPVVYEDGVNLSQINLVV